jgi:hypothetical protein
LAGCCGDRGHQEKSTLPVLSAFLDATCTVSFPSISASEAQFVFVTSQIMNWHQSKRLEGCGLHLGCLVVNWATGMYFFFLLLPPYLYIFAWASFNPQFFFAIIFFPFLPTCSLIY